MVGSVLSGSKENPLFFVITSHKIIRNPILIYCIAGNRTWLYRLPQSQIIMYSLLLGILLTCEKIKKICSSAPGQSVMTLRECRVDCPFPVAWLGKVWEPVPPHSTGLSRLFNPHFPNLKLSYHYAVTWTCDWHTWFSLICNLVTIDTTPLNNCKFGD
jgi:hypothetical protein